MRPPENAPTATLPSDARWQAACRMGACQACPPANRQNPGRSRLPRLSAAVALMCDEAATQSRSGERACRIRRVHSCTSGGGGYR